MDADVREEPGGTWLLRASISVDDLAERLDLELPEGDYTTLGGFILSRIGDLPRAGHVLVWEGHRFEMVSVTSRRITEVRLRPKNKEEAEA